MDAFVGFVRPAFEFLRPISLSPINIGVQITCIALPCLLISESFHSQLGRYVFKPIASLGFLVAAVSYLPSSNATGSTFFTSIKDQILADPSEAIAYGGACLTELQRICYSVAPTFLSSAASSSTTVHSTYTNAMMIAFILGFLGDVLLIPKKGFLPGLVSFLAGHAAFMVAFTFHGQDNKSHQGAAGFLVVMASIVGPWLIPQIKNKVMRGAVIAYMAVISGMVLTAVGSVQCGREYLPERVLGALMFFFSDLFVARQHFVQKTVLNKWIGLPLYYGGQILLASTLRGE
ncbi:hypothetical protein DFQ27_000051 [Actinomortierella ambigua]|uniref:YhhN-like protein n=1 Tax=Actinomortierella ambigua TaxID=1343610 RepID=A0A9P6UDL2_9FUNG|nr:hypothetical protein DFQ27_000051 [Actinomortierella ambigua]